MFEAGPLYQANLESTASITVNQGGTSSGKTYAILQVLLTKLLRHPGTVATVLGQDIPNLKKGPIRDLHRIIERSPGLHPFLQGFARNNHYNKSDRILTLTNGSMMEFTSYDDAQDAKSGKREWLFVNEANGISLELFEQLYVRATMQTWIDYNPDSEFWVHEQILRDPTRNVKLLISDHRHNPFVPDTLREKIEAIKDRDINLWKVYARGLTGKVEGLVFNNWHLYKPGQAEEDDNGLPKGARFLGYGLDFGFTNDPTSLIKMWAWGDDLLVREELYERGLTGSDINRRFKALEIDRRDQIIADGENRRLVTELGQYGWNTKLADKGPGSIEAGIDQLQRYKIWVLPGSPNMIKELRTYRWATDKDGKPTNKPVKFMDHTIDPMRYVARHTLKRPAREGRRYVFN